MSTDSLGGILTGGLLGNPILARFRLFVGVLIEDVTPSPTPTPLPPSVGGGGGHRSDITNTERLVKVTLIYKGHEHISVHKVNDNNLRIVINILNKIAYASEAVYSILVKIRAGIRNVKVTWKP